MYALGFRSKSAANPRRGLSQSVGRGELKGRGAVQGSAEAEKVRPRVHGDGPAPGGTSQSEGGDAAQLRRPMHGSQGGADLQVVVQMAVTIGEGEVHPDQGLVALPGSAPANATTEAASLNPPTVVSFDRCLSIEGAVYPQECDRVRNVQRYMKVIIRDR